MATECPECGRSVPEGSPDGLCPACLLRGVLEPEPLAAAERPPEGERRFGPYTILRELGGGGMGIVHLARQEEPMRREVALKVIRPGLDLGQVIARFEAERQALALMSHPNIAQVYDAGTAEGRPYFAMEYFDGSPLTEYCDAHRLGIRERLELFRQVCLAIHHAHQKGIIHRDIKPSNILAATRDGRAALKVIDFGIAKATRTDLPAQTVYTQHGLLVGTLAYMSPEQAELGTLEVDATSDIYSLGVLLYELTTGELPLDVERRRSSGYLEMLRAIREEEPLAPSGRVAAMGAGAEEAARRRRTDARTLQRRLRGELGWIAMRALEKDRGRRYASASELAADIERFLNDDPVHAGPPSQAYRAAKFVRRHRGAVAASAALLLSLLGGLAVSSTLYVSEQRQRDIAERESYAANLNNAASEVAACDSASARELLFRCPARLRGWEWRLLYALSDTSIRTLQATGENPGVYPEDGQLAFDGDSKTVWMPMAYSVHTWKTADWTPGPSYGLFGRILGMSADGSKVATAGPDETAVQVVDVRSGRAVATLKAGEAATARFSPSGEVVATASSEGRVEVWDLATGRLRFALPARGSGEAHPRLCFSRDGKLLAFSAGGRVRVVETRKGGTAGERAGRMAVHGLAFDPDGKRLALVDAANRIHVWSFAGTEERTWTETDACFAVAYSPTGDRMVTAGQQGAVRVWDARTGAMLATLSGMPGHKAAAVAFSPDGRTVVAAGAAGEVWVWELENHGGGSVLRRGALHLAGSPEGNRVADSGSGETVVRDGVGGKVLRRIPAGAPAAALGPWGKLLALGDAGGAVRMIDAGSGQQIRQWQAGGEAITSLSFSAAGELLATVSGHTARVWDAGTGAARQTISAPEVINRAVFSPDGRYLAVGAGTTGRALPGGAATLWDVSTGQPARRLEPEWEFGECVQSVAFSPDGKRIAAGECYTGTVRLCEVATGRLLAGLKGHTGAVHALAFSTDGRLLASGSQDGTIRFWDAETRELLFVLRDLGSPVEDLSFGAGAARLFSRHLDGSVRSWSTESAYPSAAVEVLVRLYQRFGLWSDVRHFLERDTDLDAGLRAESLRMCDARADGGAVFIDRVCRPILGSGRGGSDAAALLRRAEDFRRKRPYSPEAAAYLGGALYRNGRYREAIEVLEPASRVHAREPVAEAFLALALAKSGRPAEARAWLEGARPRLRALNPFYLFYIRPAILEAEKLLSGR